LSAERKIHGTTAAFPHEILRAARQQGRLPLSPQSRRERDTALSPPLPPFAKQNPRQFEICMTAARTFVERGFDATSVNDIAAAIGVTKAGLYHYISSKDALFYDILNLGMDWLDEEVIRHVTGVANAEERLHQAVFRHAKLTASNEPWITLLLDEMHALPEPQRRQIEGRKRRYFEFLRGTLLELKTDGRLRDIDPTVATFTILGMIVWIPHWIRPGGRLSGDAVAAEITRLVMNAVLLPSEGVTAAG
jgi:AcrR family transcriptional regulator